MRYLTYLILVISTTLSAGTSHKWVDENGNVHYGDSPPVKIKSQNVHVQSAPSNPGKALPRLKSSASGQQPGGDNSTGDQPQAFADQAQKICETARKDLQVISTSNRIKLAQADGTTRYLSDEEIAERKALSQAEVDRYCN